MVRKRIKYPPEVKKRAIELADQGLSLSEIAKKLKEEFKLPKEPSIYAINNWINRREEILQEYEAYKRAIDEVTRIVNTLPPEKQPMEDTKEKLVEKVASLEFQYERIPKTKAQEPEKTLKYITNRILSDIATKELAKRLATGDVIVDTFEKIAKAYGYENAVEFLYDLYDFWEKYKYEVWRSNKLKALIGKLALLYIREKLLNRNPKVMFYFDIRKIIHDIISLYIYFKFLDEEFDVDLPSLVDEILETYIRVMTKT